MRRLVVLLASTGCLAAFVPLATAQYQQGWKNYEKPQPGVAYGAREANPYGPGGSLSYGPGGGNSYGPGGGKSYGPGGGNSYGPGGANSYGPGGGKNPSNPWRPVR